VSSFTFFHTADLHLDSPLQGLSRYEGAPADRIRSATRRAFDRLVQAAISENAAFVVIAGDLFDGDWRDYNTGLFFTAVMGRLREAGIKVFLVSGNHDAASRITRSLHLPDNVHRFDASRPETVLLDNLPVAVHGRSYPRRAVRDNLALEYPPPVDGRVNVGILHTAATGRPGHAPYAPCRIEELIDKGYDYWALGHVHQQEIVHRDPWIVFPGNPQGRHINESGAKGCMRVRVSSGRVDQVQPLALDDLRWRRLAVDVGGCADADQVIDRLRAVLEATVSDAEGRLLCARIDIGGRCPAHRELTADPDKWVNEIRAAAMERWPDNVWIERVRIDTAPPLGERVDSDDGAILGDLMGFLEQPQDTPELANALAAELAPLKRKLPPLPADGGPEDDLDLDAPQMMQSLLVEAGRLLSVRLTTGKDVG
jgi:exonuclease SbcD